MLFAAVTMLASCASSKKPQNRTGKVIIIEDSKTVRTESRRTDNGKHKGWYKNTNNPHHPNTTNPGHTKAKAAKGNKGKGKGKKSK